MDSTPHAPRQQTPKLLIASWPCGQFKTICEMPLDVCLVCVPWAPTHDLEGMAEDVGELLTPRRFRHLWERADCTQLIGSTRPLLPSVALDARQTALAVAQLNAIEVCGDV